MRWLLSIPWHKDASDGNRKSSLSKKTHTTAFCLGHSGLGHWPFNSLSLSRWFLLNHRMCWIVAFLVLVLSVRSFAWGDGRSLLCVLSWELHSGCVTSRGASGCVPAGELEAQLEDASFVCPLQAGYSVSVGFDILLPVHLLLSCTWNSRRFLLSFVCYLMQEKPQVHSQVTSFPPFSSPPIFLLRGLLRFTAYLPWSVSDSNKIILKLPFESILSSFC